MIPMQFIVCQNEPNKLWFSVEVSDMLSKKKRAIGTIYIYIYQLYPPSKLGTVDDMGHDSSSIFQGSMMPLNWVYPASTQTSPVDSLKD